MPTGIGARIGPATATGLGAIQINGIFDSAILVSFASASRGLRDDETVEADMSLQWRGQRGLMGRSGWAAWSDRASVSSAQDLGGGWADDRNR